MTQGQKVVQITGKKDERETTEEAKENIVNGMDIVKM